jgi:hypothetical protein
LQALDIGGLIPMSRVERTQNPGERRDSEQSRQAERGRTAPVPTPTPSKAEGEQADIEQALENQPE